MTRENPTRPPIDIVTACRAVDLPILRLAAPSLRRFVSTGVIHVFTARSNFPKFRRALGGEVALHDEDTAIPGMTLAQLKTLALPGFPGGAGWYFQQLLKYSFSQGPGQGDHYLIWDADTIPLRPMTFFENDGRMRFTIAEEEHPPYFESYRRLLGEEPARKFSFISQHMIVENAILREMLARIEANFSGSESWAWKIMRHLEGTSTNLFSEYETLGNYVRTHYPERAAYRTSKWLRDGSLLLGHLPKPADLEQLAPEYEFAAFESSQRPWRRRVRAFRRWWHERS